MKWTLQFMAAIISSDLTAPTFKKSKCWHWKSSCAIGARASMKTPSILPISGAGIATSRAIPCTSKILHSGMSHCPIHRWCSLHQLRTVTFLPITRKINSLFCKIPTKQIRRTCFTCGWTTKLAWKAWSAAMSRNKTGMLARPDAFLCKCFFSAPCLPLFNPPCLPLPSGQIRKQCQKNRCLPTS